jgi:hypothetical protein
VFISDKFYKNCLIFFTQFWSLPPPRSLQYQWEQAYVDRARDKHSSLFCRSVSVEEISFIAVTVRLTVVGKNN